MLVEDLIVLGKKRVHSTFAKMLLADLLNTNMLALPLHLKEEVPEEIKDLYLEKLALIESKSPIQYVLGTVNFCGLSLKVDKRVLIPRFETEELVINTEDYIRKLFEKKALRIIDLGCGSGAIGLALKKKFPDSSVTLLDISEDALSVAKENAKNLDLEVNFIQSDMFCDVDGQFDVIVSNPPYLREDEDIEDIVKDNEPAIALYGGKDGLDDYRKILSTCSKHLNTKFLLAFEIGYLQKEEICALVKEYLEDVVVVCKKDMSEKDRMIFIYSK